EQRLAFWLDPRFVRGGALTVQGAFEEAVACLREGLAGRHGTRPLRVYGLARLAEALARQGEYAAALATVQESIKEQEDQEWAAELRRLEGVALVGLNRLDEGEHALEEALRIARKQKAKSYELRAATSLARLRGEQGRRAEAQKLLALVYGWFTEGF